MRARTIEPRGERKDSADSDNREEAASDSIWEIWERHGPEIEARARQEFESPRFQQLMQLIAEERAVQAIRRARGSGPQLLPLPRRLGYFAEFRLIPFAADGALDDYVPQGVIDALEGLKERFEVQHRATFGPQAALTAIFRRYPEGLPQEVEEQERYLRGFIMEVYPEYADQLSGTPEQVISELRAIARAFDASDRKRGRPLTREAMARNVARSFGLVVRTDIRERPGR